MPSIKINIVANLVGKVWGAAIGILLLPYYIRYLGIESYGLVGFYATLISSMVILDLGLSTTLNRELAKYKSENKSPENIRDLAFSLECIYWAIGMFICCLIISLSWLIARYWVKAEQLPVDVIRQSVILMGIVLAFQWPISLYNGGLTGLEKQVLNNTVTVIMTTIRAAGVIIVLKYFSATVQAFFLWQAAISLLYVVTMRWALWKEMPVFPARPKFSKGQLKIIWRFAAGMTSISIVTFFLSQVDKIVLSKMLPLSQFGYYTLAYTIAASISLIAGPISITFFPRFASLIASNNNTELKKIYHQACKLMATLIFPFSFVLIFFTQDVLRVLIKNADTTAHTYLLARILIVGSVFNALMIMPYNLLVANGWTRFTIYQNAIAALILVPLLFFLTNLYGAIGATLVWVIVNAGYIFISQPLMHRKLLKNELAQWYWKDTFLPMLPSLLIVLLIKISFLFFFEDVQLNFVLIGFVWLISFVCSILFMEEARVFIKGLKHFSHDRRES